MNGVSQTDCFALPLRIVHETRELPFTLSYLTKLVTVFVSGG